jgi:hypothetical protein
MHLLIIILLILYIVSFVTTIIGFFGVLFTVFRDNNVGLNFCTKLTTYSLLSWIVSFMLIIYILEINNF